MSVASRWFYIITVQFNNLPSGPRLILVRAEHDRLINGSDITLQYSYFIDQMSEQALAPYWAGSD
jgi:hypothetical protein